jgi:hypothetical protein
MKCFDFEQRLKVFVLKLKVLLLLLLFGRKKRLLSDSYYEV